ncbi:MAG: phytanoyl-CoA dioxygenase family protein [Alphaproteobacteria bacterium]
MPDNTLTQNERDCFARDGFVFKRGLFDAEEVGFLARAITRDDGIARNIMLRPDSEGGNAELVVWNHPGDDVFGAVARCARVVDGMESLLGGEVYHYHSKLTMKAPGSGGAWNWHQDYGYWYQNGCLFPDMASVMIAVDAATNENGCLQVLAGSHLMGRVEHGLHGGQTSADPERVDEAMKSLELVSCEMAPGDALFFHCNLLHYSAQNKSAKPRTMLLCCYNAASNNPYKEHHHPRYTPLHKLPDSAVKEFGLCQAGATRVFMHREDDHTGTEFELKN